MLIETLGSHQNPDITKLSLESSNGSATQLQPECTSPTVKG